MKTEFSVTQLRKRMSRRLKRRISLISSVRVINYNGKIIELMSHDDIDLLLKRPPEIRKWKRNNAPYRSIGY